MRIYHTHAVGLDYKMFIIYSVQTTKFIWRRNYGRRKFSVVQSKSKHPCSATWLQEYPGICDLLRITQSNSVR